MTEMLDGVPLRDVDAEHGPVVVEPVGIPQFESVDEAVAWLQAYSSESDDKAWQRCFGVAVVLSQFPGKDTEERIQKGLLCKRRMIYYWYAAGLDWPPDKRYLDHSCDWHVAVSAAARSDVRRRADYDHKKYDAQLADTLERVADASVLHAAGFVWQVAALAQRRIRQAQDVEGKTQAAAYAANRYELVMQQVQDAGYDEVAEMAAEVCPTCGRRLPFDQWGKGIGVMGVTRGRDTRDISQRQR